MVEEGIIKGTKVTAVIKKMLSRDKDQTWKIDIYTQKEHEVPKNHTYKYKS